MKPAASVVVAAFAGWLALACDDTRARDTNARCAVRLSRERAAAAAVSTRAFDATGSDVYTCSGAVVAPNVVLTAAHCISARPAIMPNAAPEAFECTPAWELVERGDGRGRIGVLYPADAVRISVRIQNGFLSELARGRALVSFGAQTRCRDDLAAIILDQALDIAPLPLRVAATALDEELALAVVPPSTAEPRERPLRVAYIAPPLGADEAPPRAFRLAGDVCAADLGAPVFSPRTGALVALPFLALSAGGDCTAAGEVIALRLAEYAEFLDGVAALAGAELRVEAEGDAPEGDAHCSRSVLGETDAGE
jgi:hypothetical protein